MGNGEIARRGIEECVPHDEIELVPVYLLPCRLHRRGGFHLEICREPASEQGTCAVALFDKQDSRHEESSGVNSVHVVYYLSRSKSMDFNVTLDAQKAYFIQGFYKFLLRCQIIKIFRLEVPRP